MNSSPTGASLYAASLQDQETVTAAGASLTKLPHGCVIRDLTVHTDDRGTVMEMYDPRWGFHPDPLVFSYFFTIRPGWAKGWGMHRHHEDRYCLMQGEMKLVMYDAREDSPTFGLSSEVYLSEQRRQIVNVPTGVWHADENLGTDDVLVVNFPTIQYDHTAPDKYRLPLHTPLIPYRFADSVRGY